MRKRALPILVFLAIAMSVTVSPASAQTILAEYDIFNDTGDWTGGILRQVVFTDFTLDTILGVRFVATATGTVSSIQVPVSRTGPANVPITWTIRSTYVSSYDGIQPDFSATGALSTGTLEADGCPDARSGWVSVQMTPAELVEGQTHALVASAVGLTDSYYYWWSMHGGEGYNGKYLVGYVTQPQEQLGTSTGDLGFRIVAVPEPSSVLAMMGGLVGLIGLRRRRA